MSIAYRLLVLIFLFFPGTPVHAEQAIPAHIIIAADQSGSMFKSGHITVQTNAIINALARYTEDCSLVRLSYLAWGSRTLETVTGSLDTFENRYELVANISQVSATSLGLTAHELGYQEAKNLVRPEERTVMIIITDGTNRHPDLTVYDDPQFTVHKIALNNKDAEFYLENRFLPGVGENHFATDTDEVEHLIRAVLDTVQTELCLG
jgi:hypothetical protein